MKLTQGDIKAVCDKMDVDLFSDKEMLIQTDINELTKQVFDSVIAFYDRKDVIEKTFAPISVVVGDITIEGVFDVPYDCPDYMLDTSLDLQSIKYATHFMLDNAFKQIGGFDGLVTEVTDLSIRVGYLNVQRSLMFHKVTKILNKVDTTEELHEAFNAIWPQGKRFLPVLVYETPTYDHTIIADIASLRDLVIAQGS